mmetsp:Transcript_22021/g.62590  ORF Transcript_22021/g.62590 Transcript_22021/m.62590 type:complete len:605 (+) Transcript_22021:142-1956(+)
MEHDALSRGGAPQTGRARSRDPGGKSDVQARVCEGGERKDGRVLVVERAVDLAGSESADRAALLLAVDGAVHNVVGAAQLDALAHERGQRRRQRKGGGAGAVARAVAREHRDPGTAEQIAVGLLYQPALQADKVLAVRHATVVRAGGSPLLQAEAGAVERPHARLVVADGLVLHARRGLHREELEALALPLERRDEGPLARVELNRVVAAHEHLGRCRPGRLAQRAAQMVHVAEVVEVELVLGDARYQRRLELVDGRVQRRRRHRGLQVGGPVQVERELWRRLGMRGAEDAQICARHALARRPRGVACRIGRGRGRRGRGGGRGPREVADALGDPGLVVQHRPAPFARDGQRPRRREVEQLEPLGQLEGGQRAVLVRGRDVAALIARRAAAAAARRAGPEAKLPFVQLGEGEREVLRKAALVGREQLLPAPRPGCRRRAHQRPRRVCGRAVGPVLRRPGPFALAVAVALGVGNGSAVPPPGRRGRLGRVRGHDGMREDLVAEAMLGAGREGVARVQPSQGHLLLGREVGAGIPEAVALVRVHAARAPGDARAAQLLNGDAAGEADHVRAREGLLVALEERLEHGHGRVALGRIEAARPAEERPR